MGKVQKMCSVQRVPWLWLGTTHAVARNAESQYTVTFEMMKVRANREFRLTDVSARLAPSDGANNKEQVMLMKEQVSRQRLEERGGRHTFSKLFHSFSYLI